MDTEALKIILDLQHKVSIYERIFEDIVLALTPGHEAECRNYNVDVPVQSYAICIFKDITSLQKRILELEKQSSEADNT